MSIRQSLAIVLAAAMLSAAMVFATVALTEKARAGGSSQVVSQLKSLNGAVKDNGRVLKAIDDGIGSSQIDSGSVRGLLNRVCVELEQANGEFSSIC